MAKYQKLPNWYQRPKTRLQRYENTKWTRLPFEVRNMILVEVAADKDQAGQLKKKTPYVVVSKEWQAFFESINFRRLILSRHCLRDFAAIVTGDRRSYVQRAWLRVEVAAYDYRRCTQPENSHEFRKNDQIFDKAIQELYSVLSKWPSSNGLLLELSVHSPSDSMHKFSDRKFDAFSYSGNEVFGEEHQARDFGEVRDQYGRLIPVASRSTVLENPSAALRYFGNFLRLAEGKPLPKVNVVTGLLIRRQYQRKLAAETVRRLFESLPSLERINLEIWREMTSFVEANRNRDYGGAFKLGLPASVKRVSMFEDFDMFIHGKLMPDLDPEPILVSALLDASRLLEHFSAPFLIDARDFLGVFHPQKWNVKDQSHAWKCLTTLSLTTQQFKSTESQEDIDIVLLSAGNAATRMPKLQTMEIWNGTKGDAAVFRYHVAERKHGLLSTERTVTLSWYSSWDSYLADKVVSVWRDVAREHTRCELTVDVAIIQEPPKSYGTVLQHLELGREILHPVSMFQIQSEAAHL